MTEKEYNSSVMNLVQFSLAITKIAEDKAADNAVKEFVVFERTEGNAIVNVLKDLDTVIIELDDEAQNAFSAIESCEAGPGFDKLFIRAQLKNHRNLRDLTEDYMDEAPAKKLDIEESQYKHLAILMLTVFIEHVTIAERIHKDLGGDAERAAANNTDIEKANS
ncbi:MAG: hypothetical protein ABIN01_06440 [Ferruginibacter sp.]